MDQHNDLLLPHLRVHLILALEDLANIENRLIQSPQGNCEYAFSDLILRTLDVFDELDMQDSPPNNHIGSILYNATEAKFVSQVIAAITSVCDKIGPKKPDSAYINSSLWEKLIYAAKRAYDVLLANEQSDLFDTKHNTHGHETSDFNLNKNSKATLCTWWNRRLSKPGKTLVPHGRSDLDLYKDGTKGCVKEYKVL